MQAGAAHQVAHQLRGFDQRTVVVLQLGLRPRHRGAAFPDLAAYRFQPALAHPFAQLAAKGIALGRDEGRAQRGPALVHAAGRQAAARAARLVEEVDFPARGGKHAGTTGAGDACADDAGP